MVHIGNVKERSRIAQKEVKYVRKENVSESVDEQAVGRSHYWHYDWRDWKTRQDNCAWSGCREVVAQAEMVAGQSAGAVGPSEVRLPDRAPPQCQAAGWQRSTHRQPGEDKSASRMHDPWSLAD